MKERTCPECGQPINFQKDSFTLKDGQTWHERCCRKQEKRERPKPPPPAPDPKPDDDAALLTIKEAAQLLRVSVSTIRAYIRSQDLPSFTIKPGRFVRLKRSDVTALVTPRRP